LEEGMNVKIGFRVDSKLIIGLLDKMANGILQTVEILAFQVP
jgi:hypothetical protein